MARIRTIKPEFWSSEQIMDLSPMARLTFIGLWNFCDDGGNHPASAKTLKAEIFPSDDITSSNVQLLIDELSSNSLITCYSSGGKEFWHVIGWKHQKIDKPTFKHPPFLGEESNTSRRGLDDSSPPEGKGRERSKPISPNSSVVDTDSRDDENSSNTQPGDHPPTNSTRPGALCKRLRLLGIDAAPHLMQSPQWHAVLAQHDDDAIAAVAEIAKAKRPNERLSLNYLIPMLNDPGTYGGNSHANHRNNVAATVAAFTGSGTDDPGGTVIEGSAERVVEAGCADI